MTLLLSDDRWGVRRESVLFVACAEKALFADRAIESDLFLFPYHRD
jgi:hypothetical protein